MICKYRVLFSIATRISSWELLGLCKNRELCSLFEASLVFCDSKNRELCSLFMASQVFCNRGCSGNKLIQNKGCINAKRGLNSLAELWIKFNYNITFETNDKIIDAYIRRNYLFFAAKYIDN